jgi:hypothetical protein
MHHPKRGFRKSLLFVSLFVIIFSTAMLMTNYKDKSGNINIENSEVLMKVKEEALKPIDAILSVGKGSLSQQLLIDDVVTSDDELVGETLYDDYELAQQIEPSETTESNIIDLPPPRYVYYKGDEFEEGFYEYKEMNQQWVGVRDVISTDKMVWYQLSGKAKEFTKSEMDTALDSGASDEPVSSTGGDSTTTADTNNAVTSDDEVVPPKTEPTETKKTPTKDTKQQAKSTAKTPYITSKDLSEAIITIENAKKGDVYYTPNGYKFTSEGEDSWKITDPDGKPYTKDTSYVLNYLKSKSCAEGTCFFDEKGTSVFGKTVSPDILEKAIKTSYNHPKNKIATQSTKLSEQTISASYGGFDDQGDLLIKINKNGVQDTKHPQYFFRDKSLFDDAIYKIDPKTKEKKLCTQCDVKKEDDGYYLIDKSLKGKVQSKFKLDKDPDDEQEIILKQCDGKFDTPECKNAGVLMDKVYDSLNFEFRSRVESVFGALLDKWTVGWLGSRMEVALQASVCNLQYYRTEDTETSIISGVQTKMPNFVLDYEGSEIRKLFVVDIGGEKEEITPTLYRYAFSIKLIGQMHYLIYLQNSCTATKSFDAILKSTSSESDSFSWKKYFDGEYTSEVTSSKIEFDGWRDEGIINRPKGTHIVHYSGDDMTFNCEENENCRFNQACVKIIDDGTIEYEKDQTKPYCVYLNSGQGFETEGITGTIEC